MMMKIKIKIKIIFISCLLLITTGCLYSPKINQGTNVSKSHIERLEVGMAQEEVVEILGSPNIVDPYHLHRWEYVFWEDGDEEVKTLVIFFVNEVITKIESKTSSL